MTDRKAYILPVSILLGIVMGGCCASLELSDKALYISISAIVAMLVISHAFCYRKLWLRQVFTVTTIISFMSFGFFASYRSHHRAYIVHGERYQYEIYHSNGFQNDEALHVRSRLHQFFARHSGISTDEASVVEAMTIGWREDIPPSLRNTFARAGISHLLALSGYHLGLILFVFYALIYRRAMRGQKPYLTALLLTLLWGYAFVTGMSPSMIRAVIMCTVALLGNLFGRSAPLMLSTLMAAVVILLIEPRFIYHVGFQLSFLSMLGISLFRHPISSCHPLLAPIVISLVCTLATFPLVAHVFGTVSLVGVLANAIASLIVPAIMCLSALWWIFAPVSTALSHILAIPLEWFTSLLISTADLLSSLPISTISYRPALLSTIILYALLATIIVIAKKISKERKVKRIK